MSTSPGKVIVLCSLGAVMALLILSVSLPGVRAERTEVSFDLADNTDYIVAQPRIMATFPDQALIPSDGQLYLPFTVEQGYTKIALNVPLSTISQHLSDQEIAVNIEQVPLGEVSRISITHLLTGLPQNVATVDLILDGNLNCRFYEEDGTTLLKSVTVTNWGEDIAHIPFDASVPEKVVTTLSYSLDVSVVADVIGLSPLDLLSPRSLASEVGTPSFTTSIVSHFDPPGEKGTFDLSQYSLLLGAIGAVVIISVLVLWKYPRKK
jgi:hypothetical protein